MGTRSILDLELKDLLEIQSTGKMLPNVDLSKIETLDKPTFEKLFRARSNPTRLATILLEHKGVTKPASKGQKIKYESTISDDQRERRMSLKEREMDLKEKKIEIKTQMWEEIQDLKRQLSQIEEKFSLQAKVLKAILEQLTSLNKTLGKEVK